MTTYIPPKKNTEFIFYVSLTSQSARPQFQANPTLATGDAKVSIDGGAFNNLSTLPAVTPASGRAVKVTVSAAEMNGDNIVVQLVDASGAEWDDLLLSIQTSARQVDDIIVNQIAVKKNTALPAFPFVMFDSDDGTTAAGLTVTATRSIDGGAFAACANAVTEVSAGWYKIDLAAADLNGTTIALKFTATGASPTNFSIVTQA